MTSSRIIPNSLLEILWCMELISDQEHNDLADMLEVHFGIEDIPW